MRVKKYYGLLAIIGSILILTGCGEQFPDLTQEQYDQTVEYAVGLLMKYSNNGQERLVYVDAREEKKSRERQARKEAREAQKEQETVQETKPQKTQVKETTNPPAETPVLTTEYNTETPEKEQTMTGEDMVSAQDASTAPETVQEQEPETQQENTRPGAITLSSDQSQEIAPDLFLSYQGYSVSSTYPESSKSYVVNADKGKKLLVLRFDLYNGSDASKEVNMLKYNLLFQILLNDNNIGYTSVTFLPNDLSSYIGTIESRAHASLVILTQISESDSKNIDSLGMIVGENGSEQTVYLE